MRRHVVPVIALSLLAVTSGCAGLAVDTVPSASPSDSPATPTLDSCASQTLGYDISIPDRPDELTESSAAALAKIVERRYERARIRTDYENVTISSAGFREVSTEPIDNGIEVTVRFHVAFSTDRLTASGGYPTTYRVTDDRLVRDGHTLACWSRST